MDLSRVLPGPYLERVPTEGSIKQTVVVLPRGVELIRVLAREGYPRPAVAASLGICRMTLAEVMERQPEVREAYDHGRAALEAECAARVLAHARGGAIAGDFFLLKTRFSYREHGEPRGDNKPPVVGIQINLPAALSEEEYARLLTVTQQPPPEDAHDDAHDENHDAHDDAHRTTHHDAARAFIAQGRQPK